MPKHGEESRGGSSRLRYIGYGKPGLVNRTSLMNRHRRKPVSLLPRLTGSAPLPRQRLVVLIERIFYTRARDLQARVFRIGAEDRGEGAGSGFSVTSELMEPGQFGGNV